MNEKIEGEGVNDTIQQSVTIQQLYSTSMVGPYVQLFILDYRRQYLGRDQIAWLSESLNNSTARFKVILSGCPFGMTTNTPMSAAATAGQGDRKVIGSRKENLPSDQKKHSIPSNISDITSLLNAADIKDIDMNGNIASVSMQVISPLEGAGWDEDGRLKLSLQAVIASYQSLYNTRQNEKKDDKKERNDKNNRNHNKNNDSRNSDNCDNPISENNNECNISAKEHSSEEYISKEKSLIEVESGIIILSAGACVPINITPPLPTRIEIQDIRSTKRKSIDKGMDRSDINNKQKKSIDEKDDNKEKEREKRKSADSLGLLNKESKDDSVVVVNNESKCSSAAPTRPSSSRRGSTNGLRKSLDNDTNNTTNNNGDSIYDNYNKKDSLVLPYAATYNPKEYGKPFCFEICIGGGAGVGEISETQTLLPPVKLPLLGGKLIYSYKNQNDSDNNNVNNNKGNNNDKNDMNYDNNNINNTNTKDTKNSSSPCSIILSLNQDGLSMNLKLLKLKLDQSEPSVMYQCNIKASN